MAAVNAWISLAGPAAAVASHARARCVITFWLSLANGHDTINVVPAPKLRSTVTSPGSEVLRMAQGLRIRIRPSELDSDHGSMRHSICSLGTSPFFSSLVVLMGCQAISSA